MAHGSIRRIIPLAGLLLAVVAAVIYLAVVSNEAGGPLQASGTVSAVEISIASEMAGRVAEVLVEEGESVETGDLLFLLDDTLLQSQRTRLLAALATAQATEESAQVGVEVARLQLAVATTAARAQEAPLRATEWQQDAPWLFTLPTWYFETGEAIRAAESNVEEAAQALQAARSDLEALLSAEDLRALQETEERLALALAAYNAAREVYDRASLARNTQDLLDEADARLQEAGDALEEAQRAYDDLFEEEADEEILQARAILAWSQANYDVARDQLARLQAGDESLQVRLAQAGVSQAETALAQARAVVQQTGSELAALDVQLDRLAVIAPAAGVVVTRNLEVGEVVSPGGVVMTLAQQDTLTITVYVPEDRYGEIDLGDRAEVTVDSFPDETFAARVVRIAERAEFTPRNVQTEEGRRTTVFAVELSLVDPGGKLKPGMPADVVFEPPA